MRKLIGSVVATAALLVAGMGNAAPVELTFVREAATTWNLTISGVDAGVGIAAVAFNIRLPSGPALDFTIASGALASGVQAFPNTGASVKNFSTVGSNSNMQIVLNATQSNFLVGPATLLLGTLTATNAFACQDAGCTFFLNGDADGGTVQEGDTGDFNSLGYTVRFVPEPAVMILLGIGLAGLGLVRRSA